MNHPLPGTVSIRSPWRQSQWDIRSGTLGRNRTRGTRSGIRSDDPGDEGESPATCPDKASRLVSRPVNVQRRSSS
jgi:hypothetical protein